MLIVAKDDRSKRYRIEELLFYLSEQIHYIDFMEVCYDMNDIKQDRSMRDHSDRI